MATIRTLPEKIILVTEYQDDSLSFLFAATGVQIICRMYEGWLGIGTVVSIYCEQKDRDLVVALLTALEERYYE